MPWWKYLLGASIILMWTCVLYAPVRGGEFLWDDDSWLNRSPITLADDGIVRVWFTTANHDYWPLTSSAFWVQYRLWGDNPDGYRAVNIALHALAAVCLWMVFRAMKIPAAWLGALLFAIHPVCVASVAWISELKNTLSMLLAALALLAYLRFDSKRSTLAYALALAAFVLALTAKTSIVMLPAVFVIAAWWRRGRIRKSDVWPVAPFAAMAAMMAAMTVFFQHRQTMAMKLLPVIDVPQRAGIAARALWFYLAKSLMPIGLNAHYPMWNTELMAISPLVAIVVALAVSFFLWRARGGWKRAPAAVWAAFALMLLPVLGLVDMSFMQFAFVSDHLQYVALPAVAAGLAAGVWRLARWRGRIGLTVAMVIAVAGVAALSVLTWRRAGVYANSMNLWSDTVAKNPGSWLAHNELGVQFDKLGESERALAAYEKAVRLNDRHPDGHMNLANSYSQRAVVARNEGRQQDAMADLRRAQRHFARAEELGPPDAELLRDWGDMLVRAGRFEEADIVLSKALRINPDYPPAHLQLALSANQRGLTDRAVFHYRRALALRPDWEKPLVNLAALLVMVADKDAARPGEALRLARRATEVARTDRFMALAVWAEAEAQAGNFTKAQAAARQAMHWARSKGQIKQAEMARQWVDRYGQGQTYRRTSKPSENHQLQSQPADTPRP